MYIYVYYLTFLFETKERTIHWERKSENIPFYRFKLLLRSVKRRLQSEDTRPTCIWMSGKNPTDFHNRDISRSNSIETITHNPQKCMRNWLRKVYRHLLLLVHPPEKKRKKHVDIFGGDHCVIIFAHISYESYRRWLWAISFWNISFNIFALGGNENRGFTSCCTERRGREEGNSQRKEKKTWSSSLLLFPIYITNSLPPTCFTWLPTCFKLSACFKPDLPGPINQDPSNKNLKTPTKP